MKIVVIYGSPTKGNTYRAVAFFKKEMIMHGEVEFAEIFLPKDLPNFCCGCMTCFMKGEQSCPQAPYTMPIIEMMSSADALILTTPVYALAVSGCMKSFLDHFAYIFIVHRPRVDMFSKKALIIASTVGAGTKAAVKTIATSLRYWGVNRVFSCRFATFGVEWDEMDADKKQKLQKRMVKKAARFYKEIASRKRRRPYIWIRIMFLVRKKMMKKYDDETSLDKKYWVDKGWYAGNKTPFSHE